MKKLTLEYIAGFVDGEGSFSMRPNGRGSYKPAFCITNTNLHILKDIQKYLYLNLKITTRYPKNPNWKPCHYLSLDSINDCKAIARLLEPYLRLKKEHAQIIMQYPRARHIHRGHGREVDFFTRALQLKLRNRIMALNKRGPDKKEVI